jgi:hypothetical protein
MLFCRFAGRPHLLAILTLTVVMSAHGAADTDGVLSGKDLDGWEGTIKDHWSVKDGCIVGTNAHPRRPTFSFQPQINLWTKKRYQDFEMTFKVKIKDGKGLGLVSIHGEYGGFSGSKDLHFNSTGHHHQALFGGSNWGSVYGANAGGVDRRAPKDVVDKVLRSAEFNDYYIKCVGKHLTIKLNGATTVEADFPKMPPSGRIGLQLDPAFQMEATFKEIQIKDLKPIPKREQDP